jgi:hypothetical protein
MYSPARREAGIIFFPSGRKTNKVLIPDARPRVESAPGGGPGKFLFLRRKKARSADLFVFVFLFAWG